MREFWYNYVKPKYGENAALQTASFIVYVKIDDIFKGISEDFETGFDTSIFELDRPLPKGKIKR